MVIRSQLEKTGYSLETSYPKERLTINFPRKDYTIFAQYTKAKPNLSNV